MPISMLRFKRGDNAGELDTRPTPDPTGAPSDTTTVHITSQADFSLLLPGRQGGEYYFQQLRKWMAV